MARPALRTLPSPGEAGAVLVELEQALAPQLFGGLAYRLSGMAPEMLRERQPRAGGGLPEPLDESPAQPPARLRERTASGSEAVPRWRQDPAPSGPRLEE